MSQVEQELEALRKTIDTLIRKSGFTQQQLEEAIGWGRSFISQMVNDRKELRVEPILRILEKLGMTFSQFCALHFQWKGLEEVEDPAVTALDRRLDELQRFTLALAEALVARNLIAANEINLPPSTEPRQPGRPRGRRAAKAPISPVAAT